VGYDYFCIFSFHFLEAPPDHLRDYFLIPPSLNVDLSKENIIASPQHISTTCQKQSCDRYSVYLTVILRGRARYELICITNEVVGRVSYYQLISGKSEKNNCFSKFSSNSLDFFGWNLLKSWHFLHRRRREKIFSDLQNFSTRNSPSVFPYERNVVWSAVFEIEWRYDPRTCWTI